MQAPTSIAEYLALVRRSGVIEPAWLDSYIEQLHTARKLPDKPRAFARLLIRDGVLTCFEAEQFLMGKCRGFVVGKYRVVERLGIGGMGIVYLCEHLSMHRRVAVKVLSSVHAEDPWSRDRFHREAQAGGALDHPNIVRAHDFDQEGSLQFLVMEYVDGTSLEHIVQRFGRMDIGRAAHYMRQAALGLQHAHEAGLVHRDIKPGNLLLDRRGVVKILDMGLARFFHDQTDWLGSANGDDKRMLGTADYLAPEQALNSNRVDIRGDIYSLGATFYYVLTGSPPFSDKSLAQKLIAHQMRCPNPIRELRPEVPGPLAALIHRLLAKDPADRLPTPAQVAEALGPWLKKPIPAPPEAEMPRLSPAARRPRSFRPAAPMVDFSLQGSRLLSAGLLSAQDTATGPANTLTNGSAPTPTSQGGQNQRAVPTPCNELAGSNSKIALSIPGAPLSSDDSTYHSGKALVAYGDAISKRSAGEARKASALSPLAARCVAALPG